jgi:hypothetical protein
MLSWKDEKVRQEHYQELLREAEQERLIRQAMAAREEPAVWEKVKGLFSGFGKANQTTKEETCTSCPSATNLTI